MSIGEFDLIQKYFMRSMTHFPWVSLGIGDDSAILKIPAGEELVTSIDTLVKDIHFLANSPALDIGYKSLAVSLSDMAAMGANPKAVLLSLTLPEVDEAWLENFARGFFSLVNEYQVPLIGGNLTKGPLTINTVVNGFIPSGKAILRSGAKENDLIYVTGTLGNAGFALQKKLLNRLNRPAIRVEVGIALRDIAHSAIDISDGLVADLKKILTASGVGAIIETAKLPLSDFVKKHCPPEEALKFALSAGDDYELCFTIPLTKKSLLEQQLSKLNSPFTCIGHIKKELGLTIINDQGTPLILEKEGFDHFK